MQTAKVRMTALILLTACWAAGASAQSDPAVGLWKNAEENRTIFIRTWQENGKMFGKVEKVLNKAGQEDTSGRCPKCDGEKKDKSVIGMIIIWDLQKDGSRWSGGKILEPDTGKTYACRIEASPDGSKLSVRGSIAFLGKTQTWTRAE